MFLDELQKKWWFEDFKDSKFKAIISEWIFSWEKAILLKPMTYMNLSWESLRTILTFYKLDFKKDIVVISDDISMDFGKVRFRDKWSAGWHNGLKSLISNFGSEEFKRIKIWVWTDNRYDTSDWVLSKFKKEEIEELEKNTFILATEMLENILKDNT